MSGPAVRVVVVRRDGERGGDRLEREQLGRPLHAGLAGHELEELAVVVAVSAAHREEAFQACRYIIDAVKLRLPIWKKEHYAEGDSHWVNCQRCANPATARERDRVGA